MNNHNNHKHHAEWHRANGTVPDEAEMNHRTQQAFPATYVQNAQAWKKQLQFIKIGQLVLAENGFISDDDLEILEHPYQYVVGNNRLQEGMMLDSLDEFLEIEDGCYDLTVMQEKGRVYCIIQIKAHYGNCPRCFKAAPIGVVCELCHINNHGSHRSKRIYFVPDSQIQDDYEDEGELKAMVKMAKPFVLGRRFGHALDVKLDADSYIPNSRGYNPNGEHYRVLSIDSIITRDVANQDYNFLFRYEEGLEQLTHVSRAKVRTAVDGFFERGLFTPGQRNEIEERRQELDTENWDMEDFEIVEAELQLL